MPKFPLIPTLVVLAAVAIMIALGFWQLGRMDEKEALIERYQAALTDGQLRPFPGDAGGAASEDDLFHPTAFECAQVLGQSTTAARNAAGQSGYAHIAQCQTDRGAAEVKLGWSNDFAPVAWDGGPVEGLIVPGGEDGARVQLANPVAGLSALAKPDPKDLPNNHLAYAGQWFFFALTALVIYILALKRRQRGG